MSCDNSHRLLYQYANSPALRGLVLALTRQYCDMEEVLAQLETRLDIALSVGTQLDLIGEIVGQPRPALFESIDGEIFGFDPLAPGAPGFPSGNVPDFGWSAVGRPDRGGRFGSLAGGLIAGVLLDGDYRTLLRARIYSNRANTTVDSISEFLQFALGAGDHYVVNNTVGQVSLVVDRTLSSAEEQVILSLVPVAAGIRVEAVVQPEV